MTGGVRASTFLRGVQGWTVTARYLNNIDDENLFPQWPRNKSVKCRVFAMDRVGILFVLLNTRARLRVGLIRRGPPFRGNLT